MKPSPVELTVNEQVVRGNFYEPTMPESAKPLAVLFLHGWQGKTNDNAAQVLADHGYYAMTISFPGHNNSEGDIKQLSRAGALEAALVAYDFFESKLPAGTNICLAGNSFGGYIAALVTESRPVAALQLRVPAGLPDEGFDQPQWGKGNDDPHVAAWRATPVSPDENRAYKAMQEFDGYVQLLEAECDDRIHTQTIQNYVDAITDKSKLQYLLMKGWLHSLGDDPERNQEYQQLTLNWLEEISKLN